MQKHTREVAKCLLTNANKFVTGTRNMMKPTSGTTCSISFGSSLPLDSAFLVWLSRDCRLILSVVDA